MASQVLSGSSNPSYTNNTGENVRVVINFMQGTPYTPPRIVTRAIPGPPGSRPRIESSVAAPAVPSTLTINWAGVSVSNTSPSGLITIGRNLAFSNLYRETAQGGTQSIVGTNENGFRIITDTIAIDTAIALATGGNNASSSGTAAPTELMLAPGQTFSAVCGVYNIVVIPENG